MSQILNTSTGGYLVQLGVSDVVAILGFLLAIAVQTWGIVRFMVNRMDAQHTVVQTKMEQHQRDAAAQHEVTRSLTNQNVQELHNRINTVKDEYVKRTDIDRDLAQMHHSITSVNNSLNTQMSAVNNRLDTIITAVSKPQL